MERAFSPSMRRSVDVKYNVTLGAGSSETPPTPSSPAFRSGAEKAPQMNPRVFSAPCKMQAMGPLRALCQTLFVWRCDRGPRPATAPPAPMAITLGFVSFRYNLPGHKKHRRIHSDLTILHATDYCPASIRTLLWAARGPVPAGVRQYWCCHLVLGFRFPCPGLNRSHQNSAVDESCHPSMDSSSLSVPS